MKKERLLIHISGWFVFAAALIVYVLTLEPTTSFWDCGEFILSAAKLEINHPSGAPFFMVLGRLFSLLSFGNPQKIAVAINFLSALSSAFTIFFLFKIIFLLGKKFSSNTLFILIAALTGSLSFAFTDSFWFSAVEGEVYALSMLFFSVSLWAGLKWETEADKPGNKRWFYFIALFSGIGIGVHLLNLLVIPAIAMIVGFKKYGYSLKTAVISFFAGSALIGAILSVLSPLVLKIIAVSDRYFVNSLKLPMNSGAIPAIVLILVVMAALIFYFRKQKKALAESVIFSVLLFLSGFSIYSVDVIRSNANPPVNFGRPDNAWALISYLNREQYPKRPLIKGENFNSPVLETEDRYSWDYIDGKYQQVKLSPEYIFDEKTISWFPRMYSSQQGHPKAYHQWINIQGKKVRTPDGVFEIPTLSDQVKFFLKYQVGYMYLRYFMWNFAGRQNDLQGRGGPVKGNWISGIDFIDELRLPSPENQPEWMKNNRANNKYYLIPLLIGLVGAVFHYKKNKASFFVVAALFLMAGIGLVIYINEIPITPRERDYVFVGSFLAFCIWIGFGVLALSEQLQKFLKKGVLLTPAVILLGLITPVILLSQNFDDHDRSGRYTARDLPANILNSCPPNAILFTNGDNDTYPLLYCQEVENIRTDVRIVIMPFLSANWFINQLRNRKYDDPGLSQLIRQDKYDKNKLDFLPVHSVTDREIDWNEACQIINSDNASTKVLLANDDSADFMPSTKLKFDVMYNGQLSPLSFSLKNKRVLYKNELAFWDIVSSNARTRPICFTSSNIPQQYGLLKYTKSEAMVFRLTGEKYDQVNLMDIPNSDPEKTYTQLMEDFNWGNITDDKVNIDYNNVVNIGAYQIRNFFNQAAIAQVGEGQPEKAFQLLQKCILLFPGDKIPYDIFSVEQVRLMNVSGYSEEADKLTLKIKNYFSENLSYCDSLSEKEKQLCANDINENLYYLSKLVDANRKADNYNQLRNELNSYMVKFQAFLG